MWGIGDEKDREGIEGRLEMGKVFQDGDPLTFQGRGR